jgi:hypothetical protein
MTLINRLEQFCYDVLEDYQESKTPFVLCFQLVLT